VDGWLLTTGAAAMRIGGDVTADSTLEFFERPCKARRAETRTPFRI
jgi:hypothetical protein